MPVVQLTCSITLCPLSSLIEKQRPDAAEEGDLGVEERECVASELRVVRGLVTLNTNVLSGVLSGANGLFPHAHL